MNALRFAPVDTTVATWPHSAGSGQPAAVGRSFLEVLTEGSSRRIEMAPLRAGATAPEPVAPTNGATAALRRVLDGALGAEVRVDALMRAASSGRTFSPAQLLALQDTVFRYSQMIEVVSRTTDRMVGAIKQTLSTQV